VWFGIIACVDHKLRLETWYLPSIRRSTAIDGPHGGRKESKDKSELLNSTFINALTKWDISFFQCRICCNFV
jgi:hypothetical protein